MTKRTKTMFQLEPDSESYPKNRERVALFFSAVGIAANLILFAAKLVTGIMVGSIAIESDAVNNLSDAGASLIALVGIRLSAKRPDPDHPFGHGRIEYLTGLGISVVILFTGFELGWQSIRKIVRPSPLSGSLFYPMIAVLLFSIAVKLILFILNQKYGKKADSAPMKAASLDSLSDVGATAVVLISILVARYTDFARADGICGLLVSILILWSGFTSAKETLFPLLGPSPDPILTKKIESIVLAEPLIQSVHDLVIHDYGPGRRMVSLHAEVPMEEALIDVHAAVNRAEIAIRTTLHCDAVIHADPCDLKTPETLQLKEDLTKILNDISPEIRMHDFHVQKGKGYTTLLFDLVRPYRFAMSEEELCRTVQKEIQKRHPKHFCIIQVDEDFSK